jgi:hypothetical protein
MSTTIHEVWESMNPAPCELGCIMVDRCREERIGCKEYALYVNDGELRYPNENPEPTKRIFNKAETGRFDGRIDAEG